MRHPTSKSAFEGAPDSTKRGKVPRLPLDTAVIWSAAIPVPPRRDGNGCLHRPARKINFTQMTSVLSFGQDVGSGVEMKERDSSKFEERRGNVYENKGWAFHDPLGSGNVYENTDT